MVGGLWFHFNADRNVKGRRGKLLEIYIIAP
jgi:hypothetical protein